MRTEYRLIIQTRESQHGCQVIETQAIYLTLTEQEKELLSKVLATSDYVQSFIFGQKKGQVSTSSQGRKSDIA